MNLYAAPEGPLRSYFAESNIDVSTWHIPLYAWVRVFIRLAQNGYQILDDIFFITPGGSLDKIFPSGACLVFKDEEQLEQIVAGQLLTVLEPVP